ncbi:MAG: helix-turn-helix domain-containing protein [Burkholderiales bacterium]|nr:helix-turn-helix domain-containing protein [Burkholderiales bacterium]
MRNAKLLFGELVRSHREHRKVSQEALAKQIPNCNRSIIAHLEQGLRLPKPDMIESICTELDIPRSQWQSLASSDVQERLDFEESLAELSGRSMSLDGHDETSASSADRARKLLFSTETTHTLSQAHDHFNSVLIFYGVRPSTRSFFEHYFTPSSFASLEKFNASVETYQKDAVRLFSTIERAYSELNSVSDIEQKLRALQPRETHGYSARAEWRIPCDIADERLPYLGYISAARVRGEQNEREQLRIFLLDLATQFRSHTPASVVASIPEKTKRRMDTLLRKFKTNFDHGLFSPLWAPDADVVEREAARLAPKSVEELGVMEETQAAALKNLAHYLSSDFLDVYVATSMRSDADFVSVNTFARNLFQHEDVRSLKLRYFNPTQSWIEDRIAKGLVEALMLRRAAVTIYMAQKSDTFGKDSEASVSLGQGKPVIVYVPRLTFPDRSLDTETLFKRPRSELMTMLNAQDRLDVDDGIDEQALFAKILSTRLEDMDNAAMCQLVREHWADFDLIEEEKRIPENGRHLYREWVSECINSGSSGKDVSLIRTAIAGVFVANAITFENRARMFREIHPLALQVILSSGVLNGILVVRTVDQCAKILSRLIRNDLELALSNEQMNYRLVEKLTGSTIRVISKHTLLRHAFSAHYSIPEA